MSDLITFALIKEFVILILVSFNDHNNTKNILASKRRRITESVATSTNAADRGKTIVMMMIMIRVLGIGIMMILGNLERASKTSLTIAAGQKPGWPSDILHNFIFLAAVFQNTSCYCVLLGHI